MTDHFNLNFTASEWSLIKTALQKDRRDLARALINQVGSESKVEQREQHFGEAIGSISDIIRQINEALNQCKETEGDGNV